MHEQVASPQVLLRERMIYGHGRTAYNILVVDVGCNSNNAAGCGANVYKLHYRIGPCQVTVHGFPIGEHALSDALANDHHLLCTLAVGIVKIASGDDRNADRAEIPGRNRAEPAARILFTGRANAAFRGEAESRTKFAAVAPWN